MKNSLLLICYLLVMGTSFAQKIKPISSTSQLQGVEKCSQHIHMEKLKQHNPMIYATIEKKASETFQAKYKPHTTEQTTGIVYTVPVVFHVLHNNGAENISDAQIQDALAILNRDFRRLNADANSVDPVFQGMPADVEIEFKLANAAPNGSCFKGITRTVSVLTYDGSDGLVQVQDIVNGNDVYQGIWPHTEYLNIFVAADVDGAAGYTYGPIGDTTPTITNMYYNGIFLYHPFCGSIGTATGGDSRVLTHETGHWLGLQHVWGPGNLSGNTTNCSTDDGVQDTPNCIGVSTCDLNSNTCNSDDSYWGMPMKDNVENYMDYSNCSKMFTQGQVDRMRATINSNAVGRNNLWTSANLLATGVATGTSLCALNFSADETLICAGTSISYTPNTISGISSYSWSFPGGTPSSSSAANPTVSYLSPGTYNATLSVTSSLNGQNYTEVKTNYIYVNNSSVSLPISEGFASVTFPPSGWTLINQNGSSTWARSNTTGLAPTAGNSMLFDNYNIDDTGDNDEIRMNPVNLLGYSAAQLKFDVAYAVYSSSPPYLEGLEVLVSTDCGNTYTPVYFKSGSTLATAPPVNFQFTPSGASQWRSEIINMTPYVGQSSVIVSFKNHADYGNRLFIDNVNFNEVISPMASFTVADVNVCSGQSVSFTNTSTNSPMSYSWSFPGGTPSSSTAANPVVTYSTQGTYNVSMTATNIAGSNTITQTNYITVNQTPPVPTISVSGPIVFCSGGSVVLISSASTSNNWSNGPTTNSITVNVSGTYSVSTTDAGCTSAPSAGTTVTVYPNPSVSFDSLSALCIDEAAITLTQGVPAGGAYSGSGVASGQFYPSVAGIGSVLLTYTYTDGNSCLGTSQTTVNVEQCVGLNEQSMSLSNVFPNPSFGNLTVDVGTERLSSITVFDRLGKVLLNRIVNNVSSETIDLTFVEEGLYTLQLITTTGTKYIQLYIKK